MPDLIFRSRGDQPGQGMKTLIQGRISELPRRLAHFSFGRKPGLW